MTIVVLSLRGAAAVAVLLVLAEGVPRVAAVALALAAGLWTGVIAAASGQGAALAQAPGELAIGAALGAIAVVPLVVAATAGRLVDVAGGGRGPYTTLFALLGAAVFVAVDGPAATIGAIVDSHRTLPDVRAGVLAALGAIVPAAIRLAAPWLVAGAVASLAVGVGGRVAARATAHAPVAAAVPAALAMITASLVATFAVAAAALVR